MTENGPPGGSEIIAHAISPLLKENTAAGDDTLKVVENGGGFGVEVAGAHRIWVAGLVDVAEGKLLQAAQPQGWRYLVLEGETPVSSASLRREGDTLSFSHLTSGPYVAATVQAIGVAERAPQVAEANFELRLLDVEGLHLRTLWLHADVADWLIPLAPAPGGVKPYKLYSENELLEVIRPLAERWADFTEKEGG